MDNTIIELVGLTKKYGSHTAVDHLNLSINKGEVFGLLGPNGAGKSTTILMMLGLTEPTSGYVRVCGIDSTSTPVEVKKKVGYMPEDVGFYDDMTGLENLLYTAQLNGLGPKGARQKAEEVLEKVGLAAEYGKKTAKYSRGMRQRLGLADVLIKDPEVIILDEPTLGIDPKGVRELLSLIRKLSQEEGMTIMLCSHHLHQVQQICDRVGLFVSGKLIAEGAIEVLSQKLFVNDPLLVEAGITAPDAAANWNERLNESLKAIDGVLNINNNGSLHIGCSRDVTAEIAKVIVESGAGLYHLCKKEYGLDDIYQRYFEEEVSHE